MFSELDRMSFERVAPLSLKEKFVFPLILAVIQHKQGGWVFVDNRAHPASALIVTNFGFSQLIGEDHFDNDLFHFLKFPKPHLPSYLLWYSPPLQIQFFFDGFSKKQVRRRERVRFELNNKQLSEQTSKCPEGFTVRALDKELIRKTSHFNLDIGSRFWASEDDFLKHGIGVCVIKDGTIVSLCYSACVVNNLAEIDVVTLEEYRGMGLAMIVAQNFVSECARQGITPAWDCFTSNTASMKLAKKLGFEEKQTYFFYSFNVPLDLAGNR